MASTTSNPSRAIMRASSIDSAISSASVQSAASHAHTSSTSSSNNALSQITGSSPADVQSLIQAAGSAEEAVRYLLKEKQSMTAQNSQLWRLVDKQRAMILGLNKDLERALKEKDRYRTKLKEHMGMIPPLPTGSIPSRGLSESPAPSLDEPHSRSASRSPTRGEGITRSESLASTSERGRGGIKASGLEIAIEPLSPTRERMISSPIDSSATARFEGLSQGFDLSDEVVFRGPREVTSSDIHRLHDDHERNESPTQLSPKMVSPLSRLPPDHRDQLHENDRRSHARTEPYEKKLGITTAVPPAPGMGKTPIRKAPPAPLEFQRSQLHNQIHHDDIGTTTQAASNSDDSWQATPDDKVGGLPMPFNNRFVGNGPLTAPPTRSPPTQYLQHMHVPLTPGPSNMNMSHRLSPEAETARIKASFVRAPLPSPGLPSSPRPVDRPPNSPMPRGFSMDSALGLPGTPKPVFQSLTIPATPRSAMPLASPRMPPFVTGHGRAASDGSVRQDSPIIELVIRPSEITTVDCRVVSSRMKPSRASMLPGKPRPSSEDSVFTLGLFSRTDGKEVLRVEKDVGALPALDSKLRKYITYHSKVPDRSLFSGYAPARVDARRAALDEYFAGIFGAVMNEPAARGLCEFFSTDVVEHYPNSIHETIKESIPPIAGDNVGLGITAVKEGYLTKRGKNFGGWKERYFVLDGPVLRYFDTPGGAQLGQIKLQGAQIGRQSASQKAKDDASGDEDNQYRHAFLVLEPKRKDSATLVRHVLCSENDKERDEWVNALLDHVSSEKEKEKEKDEDGKQKLKHSKSKDSKEAKDGSDDGDGISLRSMSYDEASQGPAPARGPTPEELSRQQVSPSPNSMLSQSGPFSSSAPVPERGHPVKQISAPTNGSVISDPAAWGAGKSAEDKKAEKAAKKRSIWGFKQRISSNSEDQGKQPAGHQQAVERFPLSRSVFGATLEEAVYLTKPPGVEVALPSVVYRCIEYLDAKNASDEEGIFRLSGSNVVIKGLREKFNTEADVNLLGHDEYYDVHAISGLLKLYLRELPNNILTSDRRDDFVKVTEMEDKNQKITALNNLVHSLPPENFALLKALSGHLLRIVDNSDVNKMTIRNVGIVFSPTLNIPAQVFSMFLHEYRYIFFLDGEAPPAPPPPTLPTLEYPSTPGFGPGPLSPRQQTFQSTDRPALSSQRMMEPPRTPMLPSHPMTIRPPGSLPPPQIVSYEPNYDTQPQITSPTQISAPRFDVMPPQDAGSSSGNGGLSVPDNGKGSKSRRRESSMMFMMGGLKKNSFTPTKSNNVAMVEEDLYG
ncbi:hypothetical protein BZA05DRAFT_415257 [Tricharina praecox]|uniref:uncharacterized protein n=1 Tax=Tricharina praecox TaxID=43433 RepID=UPI00221E8AC5|nr:uncharacterized protein BZA05DRAFT_415257 [Tricharina praecox]KAI5857874.1 hypothetical protein BZA05DRAFT_415257 [Tricharina praecox]